MSQTKVQLVDLNGLEAIIDADADTSITADTDDQIDFKAGNADTMHILNGDVRINTTAAIQPGSSSGLGVKGDINISDFTNDTSSSALVFTKSRNTTPGSQTIVNDDDQVGAIFFKADDGNASDYNNNVAAITASVDGTPGTDDTPGRLVFFTTADGARTNTERMRINRGGRVSIGTTNQDHVFQARGNGDSGTDAFLLANTRTSGTTRGLQIAYSHAPNDTQPFFICEDTSAVRFIIRNTGNVENVNNSYGATSDERVKEQIVDSSSQWNDIKSIKVKKYKMKEEVAVGDNDSLWRLGVIAQDLEESGMNGLVRDEIKYTAEDKEVVEKKVNEGDIKSYKSVKYSVLYMKAIKALQEAMAKIETLETKVKALEDA
tara:strand:- start:127 stop:1254 length:1128 start_codon:yes stop_codon:yes gene_type:complete